MSHQSATLIGVRTPLSERYPCKCQRHKPTHEPVGPSLECSPYTREHWGAMPLLVDPQKGSKSQRKEPQKRLGDTPGLEFEQNVRVDQPEHR